MKLSNELDNTCIIPLDSINPIKLRLAVAERVGMALYNSGNPYKLVTVRRGKEIIGLKVFPRSLLETVNSVIAKATHPTQV